MCRNRNSKTALFTGAILMAIGGILLLQNFGFMDSYLLWKFWPLALAGVGIGQLVLSIGTEDFPNGLWLAFTGVWLYISFQHVWGLSFEETWPMWLVAWGVAVIWRVFFKDRLPKENHNG